jgi:hypothetical protein
MAQKGDHNGFLKLTEGPGLIQYGIKVFNDADLKKLRARKKQTKNYQVCCLLREESEEERKDFRAWFFSELSSETPF